MKIALCGGIRSGKDTVADMLQDQFELKSFAFAEGIWATIELLFPEVYARRHEEKPRKLLQDLGQKLREIDSDVWIRYAFNQIRQSGSNRILVTDLRQPNEYTALKAADFTIIRVNAEPEIRIARAKAAGDNFNIQDMLHETESHFSKFEVDYEIDNNGTFEELKDQVNFLVTTIQLANAAKIEEPKGGNVGGRS